MQGALDRRDLMALATASALAGCATDRLKPKPLPTKVTDFVDIHCHIFNAADVPAAAFVVNVAAREYGFEDYKYVVAFFVALLASGAPTPQEESQKLGGRNFAGLAPTPELSDAEFETKTLAALNTLASGATVDFSPEGLSAAPTLPNEPEVRLLQRHRIPVSPKDFRVGGRRANAKAVALDYLLRKFGAAPPVPAAPGAATEIPNAPAFQSLQNSPALGALARTLTGKTQAASASDLLDRFLILARIFLDYRSANLRKLDRLFGAQSGAAARLYCPATIDYDTWVISADLDQQEQRPSAPLSDQAAIMAQIARDPRTDVLLNGYIAFDPLRAVVHRRSGSTAPSPLDVVKAAVFESGFVGAKLYPPMGFRPWNNAGITDGFGPTAERAAPHLQGHELDGELAALYTFCAQNDVPILAHCSNSQTSFEGAGERAAPQYWEQLLSKPEYRNLRVNLGHFGSLWCADSNRTPGSDEDQRCEVAKSWPAYILGMLQPDSSGNLRFPNLYFDIADVGDFTQPTYRAQLMDYLKRYLPADPQTRAKVLAHMLYGTDYMFLAMDPGLTDFAVAMENLAQDAAIGVAVDGFLWRNARTFLGLSEGTKTTTRLRSFYNNDAKHLALLNQLVLSA